MPLLPLDSDRRRAARVATIAAAPVALLALGGALLLPRAFEDVEQTGPVTMAAGELSPEATDQCRRLVADLPDAVTGHGRRPVTAGSDQNAAYGDPPITLTCGVPLPTVGTNEFLFGLDLADQGGVPQPVCWHRVQFEDRTLWTTVDRAVPVAVTVPGPIDGSLLSVSPLSVVIGADLPARPADEIPAGCR